MLDLGSEAQWFNTQWGNICYWNFLFSRNKTSDVNIGITAILVHFEKNSIGSSRGGLRNFRSELTQNSQYPINQITTSHER